MAVGRKASAARNGRPPAEEMIHDADSSLRCGVKDKTMLETSDSAWFRESESRAGDACSGVCHTPRSVQKETAGACDWVSP